MRHSSTGFVSSEDGLTKRGESGSLTLPGSPSSDFTIDNYFKYEEILICCPSASISRGKGTFLALVSHTSSNVDTIKISYMV